MVILQEIYFLSPLKILNGCLKHFKMVKLKKGILLKDLIGLELIGPLKKEIMHILKMQWI